MKTDDLIAALARESGQSPRHWRQRLALVLAGGFALAMVLVAAFWGFRPDIGVSLAPTLMKAGFSAAMAAILAALAMRLLRPGGPTRRVLVALIAFVLIAWLAGAVALFGMPAQERWEAWMNNAFPWCLVWIPIIAAPTAAGLMWFARDLAPTRLAAAGAVIGALAGSIAAMAYSMYCPVDSVAFVTTWYAVSIALCAAIGAALGSIFLRW